MSRIRDKETTRSRSLKLVGRLRAALAEPERLEPSARNVSLRFLVRTERVMERIDGVVGILETVARLEVKLLKQMVPIVDDLGELVRHSLDDVRQRRGLSPKSRAGTVIDVDPTSPKKETP